MSHAELSDQCLRGSFGTPTSAIYGQVSEISIPFAAFSEASLLSPLVTVV
jgi:hypothetical protein